MYLVREKSSKKILHVNPAPVSQDLEAQDVFFEFNEKTMEIGKTDAALPETFNINSNGEIVEATLQEKINQGIIELNSDQKIVNDTIVEISIQEQFEQGLLTLDDCKQQKISEYSKQALVLRDNILPDYKIQNAMLGIYEDKKVEEYKKTIEAFRDEFYRLKEQIEKCKTITAIDKVTEKFPTSLLGAEKSKQKKTDSNKKDDSVKNNKEKDKKVKTKTKIKKK